MDSPVMRFLEKLGDILILSVLWVICSIPVFTIGAASTALYYATIKSILGEGSVGKDFFHAFRRDFKQSLVLTLFGGVIFGLLYVDMRFVIAGGQNVPNYMQSLVGIAGFVTLAILSYAFPLLARFEWSMGGLMKTAMILGIARLPQTVVIVTLNAAPILLLLWRTDLFLTLFPIIAAVWIGGIARLNSHMFLKMFQLMGPKQEQPEEAVKAEIEE